MVAGDHAGIVSQATRTTRVQIDSMLINNFLSLLVLFENVRLDMDRSVPALSLGVSSDSPMQLSAR